MVGAIAVAAPATYLVFRWAATSSSDSSCSEALARMIISVSSRFRRLFAPHEPLEMAECATWIVPAARHCFLFLPNVGPLRLRTRVRAGEQYESRPLCAPSMGAL